MNNQGRISNIGKFMIILPILLIIILWFFTWRQFSRPIHIALPYDSVFSENAGENLNIPELEGAPAENLTPEDFFNLDEQTLMNRSVNLAFSEEKERIDEIYLKIRNGELDPGQSVFSYQGEDYPYQPTNEEVLEDVDGYEFVGEGPTTPENLSLLVDDGLESYRERRSVYQGQLLRSGFFTVLFFWIGLVLLAFRKSIANFIVRLFVRGVEAGGFFIFLVALSGLMTITYSIIVWIDGMGFVGFF